jgi:hypothetical protein
MSRDSTRQPASKARTLSRRTARRLRIARNTAAIVGIIAWGDAPTFSAALEA